jgi:protein-disulfide isomerase
MPRHYRFTSLLALLFTGIVTTDALAENSVRQKPDQWVEEILLQLSEMRKTQGDLLKRVDALQKEVTALQGAPKPGGDGALSMDLRDGRFPSLGDAKAQIAIVEFSDFECPYCRKHEQVTRRMLNENYVSSGAVRYFFVDFPLGFHSHAMGAAVAGACAHQQNKFWEMHDQLFEHQARLGDDLYQTLAADLGLDTKKFQKCLGDRSVSRQIAERLALGEQVGVQGTPAFLVGRLKNGMLTDIKTISGARPIADFEKVLSKYLPGT